MSAQALLSKCCLYMALVLNPSGLVGAVGMQAACWSGVLPVLICYTAGRVSRAALPASGSSGCLGTRHSSTGC